MQLFLSYVALFFLLFARSVSAEEVRNWPCPFPLQEQRSPEEIWGGPLPGILPVHWNQDLSVKRLVEHAASPENKPAQGTRWITQFAQQRNNDREVALMAVYAGLLVEIEALRGFLIEGIRQYVLRSKILQESIQQHEAALVELSEPASEAGRQNRRNYEQARLSDARNMDDAMEEAEFLCHRYAYLDKKLRLLTRTIRDSI